MITRPIVFFAAFVLIRCTNAPEPTKPLTETDIVDGPIVYVNKEIEPLDKSPVDIAWYPEAYPLEKYKKKINGDPVMRIIYSRPHLHGRKMGIDVVLPDTLWRMGANENNELEFFKSVTIAGKKLPAGKYVIFCMPHKTSWDIYLNRDINSWGLKLDTATAVIKATVPLEKAPFPVESLTMQFTQSATGADLNVYWGEVKVKLPVSF